MSEDYEKGYLAGQRDALERVLGRMGGREKGCLDCTAYDYLATALAELEPLKEETK